MLDPVMFISAGGAPARREMNSSWGLPATRRGPSCSSTIGPFLASGAPSRRGRCADGGMSTAGCQAGRTRSRRRRSSGGVSSANGAAHTTRRVLAGMDRHAEGRIAMPEGREPGGGHLLAGSNIRGGVDAGLFHLRFRASWRIPSDLERAGSRASVPCRCAATASRVATVKSLTWNSPLGGARDGKRDLGAERAPAMSQSRNCGFTLYERIVGV